MTELEQEDVFAQEVEALPPIDADPELPAIQPVPKNMAEVATQLALAVDNDTPVVERITRATEEIKAGRKPVLLSEMWEQERQARIEGAKAAAQAYLKAGDAQRARQAIVAAQQAEELPQPSDAELERLAVQRALEASQGAERWKMLYRTYEQADDAITEESAPVAVRNMLLQKAAELEEQATPLDKLFSFFSEVFSFGQNYSRSSAVNRVLGTNDYGVFTFYDAKTDLGRLMAGLTVGQREMLVKELMKQPLGWMGLSDNPASKALFFQKLADLTKEEAVAESVFDVWAAADFALLAKALTGLMVRGAPARAVARAGDQKAAANIVAEDLLTKAKVSGLNDAELVSKAIASGANPFDLMDEAAVQGMGAGVHQTMKARYDALIYSLKENLRSGALTPEEQARAAAFIRNSYMQNTNPHVHTVVFGEARDTGQDVTVIYQGKEGERFYSKEAAEAWAARNNKTTAKVMPLEEAMNAARANAEGPLPTTSVPIKLLEVPDSAFNGDLEDALQRVFYGESTVDEVELAGMGFTQSEITALENAGLATQGRMSRKQFGAWSNERSARLSGQRKKPKTSPAKQPQQEPTVSQQIAYHGGREWEGNGFRLGDIGTGQGGAALGRGVSSSVAEGLATRYAEKYGGNRAAVQTLDIPEDKHYINWYGDWTQQSAEVQRALTKLLGKEAVNDPAKQGMDYYRAVVDKMGDEGTATKALDEAGVYGNFADRSGPHGTGPEHLTFNPERIKRVGSRAVEGNVPKNAPKPMARDEWEEEMAKALADNNQARMDELDQIGYNFSIRKDIARDPLTEKMRAATGKGIDKDMFVARDNLLFDKDIDIKLQRVFYKWSKMLGMTTNKVRIVHIDKIDTLPYLYRELDAKPGVWEGIKRAAFRNNGVHLDLVESPDTVIIVNTLRNKPNSTDYITTMTHEFGHAFYFRTMNNMGENVRAEWRRDFRDWIRARGGLAGSAERWVGEMSPMTEETVKLLSNMRKDNIGKMYELMGSNPNLVKWYAQSEEFFAEQFAKYMLTEAKPVSVLERFFAEAAATLKAWLKDVAKLLGKDYSESAVFFREWMDEHIRRVANGEFVPELTSFNRNAAGERVALSAAREVPKPHIKPKLKQWVVVENTTVPYSYSAIGKFSDKDIESAALVAIDPKHGASELAVETRVVGIHAEAKTKKALQDYIRPFYAKLNNTEKARLQSLLEEGDSFSNDGVNFGKEFTYMEARAKGLSDEGAQAYLATRSLRMAMYHIRNGEMVRHLKAQGWQEVVIDGTTRTVGRELSLDSAKGMVGREVFNADTGAASKLTAEDVDTLYASGAKMFSLHSAVQMGKDRFTVVVGSAGKAYTRDIVTAIGYRPGEYSRIFTDEYFIKMVRKTKVDGELKELEETIRTAVSPREAQEFSRSVTAAVRLLDNPIGGNVEEQLEKLIGPYFGVDEFKAAHAAGDFDGLVEIKSHFTRNRDEFLNGSVGEALATGRMFTSKRGERIYSVDRARQNTLGVFDSLQAEMTNVSRVANINEWRETMVRRWMNSFGDLLPKRTGDDVADFFAAAGGVFTKGDQASVVAERTHKYIMRQIGVRTDEEQFYAHFTRRLTENIFKGNVPIETVGAKIRQMSILGFLRNVNFNLNLGMFNPAQLLVQSNGAATAMLLSPLHGLAAAKTFPLLRMALMSDNPTVWNFFAKAQKLSDLGLSDAGEFVRLVQAIRRSGIIDNIRSTSLWNHEDGKLNIFGGVGEAFREHHLTFFNRGEEFSRIVAFDVARREWKAANPTLDWTSENALKNIIVRADDLTQNMTKANLARFQEGVVSLPLQFAQYNIKLAINIFGAFSSGGLKGNWTKASETGRGFTKKEALQLMAGHILLYGAAGNGLVHLYDELIPEEARATMAESIKVALAEGLLAGIVNEVGRELTGERTQIAIGSRLGAFNYWNQLAELIFTDQKGVFEALGGPTAATARRLGVISDVASLWWKDENLTTEDVLKGLGEMSIEQIGTLRNAAKAYLFHMHNNKALSATGVPLAQLTTPEVLGQALGFQPSAVADVYRFIESKRDHNEALNDIANLIFRVQKDMMMAYTKGDYELAERKRLLLNSLFPTNMGDFATVQRIVRDKIYPYDTTLDKLMGEHLEKGMARPFTTTTEEPNNGSR